MTCGIYMIKNKKTNQIYIGQSNNIEQRWIYHCNATQKKQYIDRAIKKYGKDSFSFDIIEETNNLNEREKYWIKFYNTYKNKNHYNLTPGGDFSPMKIPEIAKKVSIKNLGKKRSRKTREKISKNHWDCSGEKHPQAKYKIWNIQKCGYNKTIMYKNNRLLGPCKCFRLKYNGYNVPIGYFIDFISCEIINDLIKK